MKILEYVDMRAKINMLIVIITQFFQYMIINIGKNLIKRIYFLKELKASFREAKIKSLDFNSKIDSAANKLCVINQSQNKIKMIKDKKEIDQLNCIIERELDYMNNLSNFDFDDSQMKLIERVINTLPTGYEMRYSEEYRIIREIDEIISQLLM